MWLPNLTSRIERRILFNLRVRPEYWRGTNRLPQRFHPVKVNGWTIAGVCLIRLSHVRPNFFPTRLSGRTEGAAFRVACIDTQAGGSRCVAIINRWTNSRFVKWSDMLTPMRHERADFESAESNNQFQLSVRPIGSADTCLLSAKRTSEWPADSVFESLADASAFFEAESDGHTIAERPSCECVTCAGGVALNVNAWKVTPLEIEEGAFPWLPAGSFEIDHALLMEDADCRWDWFSNSSVRK